MDLRSNDESIPEPIALNQFRGKVLVRIPHSLHRRLALEVAEAEISLNRLASGKLRRMDLIAGSSARTSSPIGRSCTPHPV
ncbi:MAG: toxin-antitoxin system HicB family antitoxin [Anaerolineales bacterium]|nr:toxin-antitoxin system HicB family antitoxin [Anaerolineales bacterium]